MQFNQGIWTTALSSICFQLTTGFTNVRIIEINYRKLFSIFTKVTENQSTNGMNPSLTTVINNVFFMRFTLIRSLFVISERYLVTRIITFPAPLQSKPTPTPSISASIKNSKGLTRSLSISCVETKAQLLSAAARFLV